MTGASPTRHDELRPLIRNLLKSSIGSFGGSGIFSRETIALSRRAGGVQIRYTNGMPELRRHYRDVNKILRKRPWVDPFFVGKYGFSPYHACAHGCLYCDGRAERYWVEGEFDRDIVIRRNAPAVLAAEIAKLRERGTVFIGSGISDAYQPPEAEEQLMAACGRVLAGRSLPVGILTKSSLVERDIDLWAEINSQAGFLLMFSLFTLDDRLRAVFEPGASPVEERLATLRAFKRRGCSIGAAAMPFLPYLADRDGDFDALAARLAGIGVDFVLPGGLTLRPGRQKDVFLGTIRRVFPDLTARYENLYDENRPSGAPRSAYSRERQKRAEQAFFKAGIPVIVPHRLYRGWIPLYDEVDVLMGQMIRHYADHAASVPRLKDAWDRYRVWLGERKRVFNRSRRIREEDLAEELKILASSAGWGDLLGNAKLAAFLREVIIDRRTFDERTRRLASF
jgi:DNA repair photolyase